MDYFMPTKLFTGKDVIANHKNEFNLGKKCLIVTGKNSAKKSGALDDVVNVLNEFGIQYLIYDGIVENPTMASCIEAGGIATNNNANFIVGIGGGSVLDATKVISVVATNEGITKADLYGLKWNNKGLPFILIGTTAGTGSEVTKVAVITDEETHRKKSGHHEDYYAKVAFGDPKYTMSLNRNYTISTGIDALAHLVESYFSNKANEISRSYSIKGVNMLIEPLSKLQDDNCVLDIDTREVLYNASILGGLAINITGTTFAHNVGYYLTENYNLPHGVACAVFMNDLLEFEEKENKEYYDTFFKDIHISDKQFKELVDSLLSVDIKMTKEEIESIMPRFENNNSVKNTKGSLKPEYIEKLLKEKFV